MRRVVGLYIRPSWVEVVELHRGLTGAGVARFGRFPLLSNDPTKLADGVKGALEAAHIRTRETILAIPSQEIFLRYFLLPLIPKAERYNAVKFEARKYVPFKMEELIWDSCVLEQPALRQIGVVFVGVRKEVLNQYVTCVRNAGLRPVAIEAASFSLARAVQYGRRAADDKVTVVIDLGGEIAHVALTKAGVPLLARDVSLTPPLESRSAEELVRQQAGGASGAVESEQRLQRLTSELHLSIDYFTREFPNDQIREILLYGERMDQTWIETLNGEFHLPVSAGESAASLRGVKQLLGGWTVPVGLGLRAAKGGEPRINLLQPEAAAVVQAGSRRFLWWAGVEAAVAAVALVVCYAALSQQAAQAQQWVAAVHRQKAALNLPYEGHALPDLTKTRERLDQRIAMLRRLIRDRIPLTTKLGALARLLPDDIWLEQLIYSAGDDSDLPGRRFRSLTLQGFCYRGSAAQELELISQLVQSLRNDSTLFQGFERTELASVKGNVTVRRFNATAFELRCLAGR